MHAIYAINDLPDSEEEKYKKSTLLLIYAFVESKMEERQQQRFVGRLQNVWKGIRRDHNHFKFFWRMSTRKLYLYEDVSIQFLGDHTDVFQSPSFILV